MKRWLRILIALLVLAIAGAWLLWFVQRPPPPASGAITLPDGSWVRIIAVTYGTNHLVGPPLSHLAYRMPQSVRTLMVRVFGRAASMRFTHTTSTPQMVLWLDRGISAKAFGNGYFECVLAETNGLAAGIPVRYDARYPLEAKEFDLFPRREPAIMLNIYHHDPTGAVFQCGSMMFANPVYRSYPKWKPEPLLATKRAGDLEVTLEKVSSGSIEDPAYFKRVAESGYDPIFAQQALTFSSSRAAGGSLTACLLSMRSLMNTNAIWGIEKVEISDATGNVISDSTDHISGADKLAVFCPSLWPSEPVWKLHFEMGGNAGLTFQDVPLGEFGQTNRIGWTTNFEGGTVTLDRIIRDLTPISQSSSASNVTCRLHLTISIPTNELQLQRVAALNLNGVEQTQLWPGSYTNGDYLFSDLPQNTRTASFWLLFKRGHRSVEFFVKPEVSTAPLEIPVR